MCTHVLEAITISQCAPNIEIKLSPSIFRDIEKEANNTCVRRIKKKLDGEIYKCALTNARNMRFFVLVYMGDKKRMTHWNDPRKWKSPGVKKGGFRMN